MTTIRLTPADLAALQNGEVLERIGGPSIRLLLAADARRHAARLEALIRDIASLALDEKGEEDLDDPDVARFYAGLLFGEVVPAAKKLSSLLPHPHARTRPEAP